MKKKQLQLPIMTLLDMGFKIVTCKKKVIDLHIKTLNGYFSFDPLRHDYMWYHSTEIESKSNHVSLDIRTFDELITVLQAFKVKINMIKTI